METLQPRTNLIMIQQHTRGSRVLRQNLAHCIQYLHRTVGHIAQIADWRGDQIQFSYRHIAKIGLRNESQAYPTLTFIEEN